MKVNLLSNQWDALTSEAKFTLLLGGVGSGKTFTGSPWILKKLEESPTSVGLITANTYSQLMTATLASVFKSLNEWNVPFNFNGQSKKLTVANKKEFLCLSAETYDNQRGIEVGEWWGDEAAYYKSEAFKVFSGRLRDKRGKLDVLLTSTPKGFNWLYDYFHPSGENNTDAYRYIKAKSTLNHHLPHGYIDSLKEQYDEQLIEQELNGEFVNLTSGKAYRAFERTDHVKEFKTPMGETYIGMDFNVDPCTCTFAKIVDGIIWFYDEIFIRNSDTPEICGEIKKKTKYATIIPDSTGANRKTSGKTDFMMIEEAGFKIMSTRNPFVIDRVNNFNRLLKLNRIMIHPRCKKLINDLEKVTWRPNTTNLDQKTDPLLTHLSDGAGYLANRLMPMSQLTQRVYSQRK